MPASGLHLLRGFALQDADRPVDVPMGTQRLMAFLALRGPAHRCVVAGTLWPDVPESHALASLRTGMWRMNRTLPGSITVNGMLLSTHPSMNIDCREQELFATELLREQVADEYWVANGLDILWKGELLPGWYDDWVVFERERLNQLRLHALEHAAVALTERRHLTAALQLALEAVRIEPLRETANAALIEVYLAEGNVVDAIHHYDTFRRLLHHELGLQPSMSLTDIVSRPRGR